MIGTSLPEYVFIRISIFALQYTTPICLVCLFILVAAQGIGALSTWAGKVAIGYSILDILYAVLVYYPHNRRLKQPAKHPPPLPRAERRALLIQCLDNVPDAARYLRMWFLGADDADIRQDNVREFLSWAFLDRHPGHETATDLEELDEYLMEIERRIGYQLKPGRGKAKSLRLTIDDVEVRYRSVVWYLLIGIVDLATHFQLSQRGFQYHAQPEPHARSVIPLRIQSLFTERRSTSQLSYWYRPHTATDKLPLVFFHGIGIGFWPYTKCLGYINMACADDDQIGIIALEYLPVSSRLTDPPLTQAEFLAQITLLVDAHGWDEFAVLGHSYGTALATHMLKSPALGPRIPSIILIDPVSILLHLPDVAYNFTRRRPRRANEYQLWYFGSTDPGVAYCLGRHFFWKDNIAWKEDLVQMAGKSSTANGASGAVDAEETRSRRVTVCLAERDLIVDTSTVLQYLLDDGVWSPPSATQRENSFGDAQRRVAKHRKDVFEHGGIEVVWFDGLDHAQAFDRKESSARLASIARRACTRSQLK